MKVLGIESSCDETAAAVVEDGSRLLSNVVASSMELHAKYGGVVPEIAARSHIEAITEVIDQALSAAMCTWKDVDAIAVTYGAGLGGSLLIGVLTARTLAIIHQKPLYAINHVEGHVYANFLTSKNEANIATSDYKLPSTQPQFPLLALIVSGGHSQMVFFRDHFDYTLLGQTHDDAIGEAFDKVAKIVGLPYPGGPSVGRKAREGNATAIDLPKAKLTNISPELQALRTQVQSTATHSYDFSFSGLKTAVLRACQQLIGEDHTFASKNVPERLTEVQKANVAASFQRVAVETVVDKVLLAYQEFSPHSVVIAGGVAASPELRRQLADRLPCPIDYTDPRLCTDNGAMIATLGCFHMKFGRPTADPYRLDIRPGLSM
ncbi:tRNA (adenosine(37)-N6)-threonylcarbamoyltransferase complex transferase subunit TsaD [Candidatus Saccharibacteria bacterium]|nr:tRNA (adenosine(37)-N6)-threonylcarbamoyltransferase complex transferase subunit TsaD [Candidatus Saccharibacteria bacterium]HPR09314.1 tRNA (adenosine(37)-N6)-threonylcarbamoyltransferase complex transferase subunit TsaD [Candidatus Saccharibacteria bacterium]